MDMTAGHRKIERMASGGRGNERRRGKDSSSLHDGRKIKEKIRPLERQRRLAQFEQGSDWRCLHE